MIVTKRVCCWNTWGNRHRRHSCWKHTCWWRIWLPTRWFLGTPTGRGSWCGSRRSLQGIYFPPSSSTPTSPALSGNSTLMYVHSINQNLSLNIYIYKYNNNYSVTHTGDMISQYNYIHVIRALVNSRLYVKLTCDRFNILSSLMSILAITTISPEYVLKTCSLRITLNINITIAYIYSSPSN